MINQTKEDFLKLIQRNENLKGVGISLNRDSKPDIGNLIIVKSTNTDISYAEALAWAKDCLVFKYIPYGVMIKDRGRFIKFISYDSIPESHWKCAGKCNSSEDCSSEVCICIQGDCY